jgi:hypothetical protein
MEVARESLIVARTHRLRPYAFVVLVFAVTTSITTAYYMGDTWIYVSDLLRARTFMESFGDFGHALWLPLVWLVSPFIDPFSRLGGGDDLRATKTITFLGITWLAGLIASLLVFELARRFSRRAFSPYLVTAIFMLSNAVLNYTQTAQPYIPALSLMLFGLYILVNNRETNEHPGLRALAAGAALAGGMCLWVAFAFSIPALLLSPLILFGVSKPRLRLVLQTTAVFALLVALVYSSTIVSRGIRDVAGLREWVQSATHGVLADAPLKSMQRMVFALARNFVNMGNDGRLFKRYLVHDSFNPVSFSELFRFSLWKLGLFYLFLVSVLMNLFSFTFGRRTLALLLVNALPLLGFAVFVFESGSIDRYMPLFPVLFLSLAVSMGSGRSVRPIAAIAVVFVLAMAFSNVSAMSSATLNREQEAVASRIRDLAPRLKPQSRVVAVNQQDEVYAFNQNFPFNPINRSGHLEADIVVDPGTTQIPRWRQIFASKTLLKWDQGGDVWITNRVFHERPQSEWNWVEGDDPRVSWTDIHAFFSQLQVSPPVGVGDSFVLVLPSDSNKRLLTEVARR